MSEFDPFSSSRELGRLWDQVVLAERALAHGRPSSSPFLLAEFPGKTLRGAISDLPLDDPLRPGLLLWCDVLMERRINFEAQRLESSALFEELHPPLAPLDRPASVAAFQHQFALALSRDQPAVAEALLRGLRERTRRLSAIRRERFARVRELEERLGEPLSPLLTWDPSGPQPPSAEEDAPSRRLSDLAWRLLEVTEEPFSALAGKGPLRHFGASLGLLASEGWPARLSRESLAELLGGDWLSRGLSLRPVALPERLSPASFFSAVEDLCREVGWALAPKDLPFTVAHHPAGLEGETLGQLMARFMCSADFVRRRLDRSGDAARQAERALWVLRCAGHRVRAVRSIALFAGRRSGDLLDETYQAAAERLGGDLGPTLGLVPVSLASDVEFCAGLLAQVRYQELRDVHDEDFIDNPRARDQIRSELGGPASGQVAFSRLESGLLELLASVPRG